MEKEKLEIVLEEVLEDSRRMRGAVEDLKQQIWQLKEKAEDFEKKVEGIKPIAPPVDIKTVQTIITVSLSRIEKLIAEQPKTVVHERRFLLFPEYHATEYYQVIFRLILWLTLACTITYLFSLGKQALENAKEVRLRELELTYAQGGFRPLHYPQEKETGEQKTQKAGDRTKKD